MSQNPTYKTGIKTLTDIQLRNGLPSYDILMDKIRVVRENARKISGLPLDGSFENLKYDNFFSILGGRGAGKTSILLTIHNKLRDDANNINVIMPLIMPELIDNGDSFIGWILSAVENELQNIENKIRERGYRKDSGSYAQMCDKYHFFERCTFNNNNTLRNTFSELKKSYYAKVYNSRRGEWDINSDMALVSSINDREFSLVEQFTKFWNQLVSTYQEFYRTSGEDKRVPLIFFMIDDADLKPQIINELIFSLPKYFSHPNVVVLISASQEILYYTVKAFMYQQITNKEFDLMSLMDMEYKYNVDIYKDSEINKRRNNNRKPLVRFNDLRYGKEYDKIAILTEEILRKLFPVANRFYLKEYDLYTDKCGLKFENMDNEVINISRQFALELNSFKKEVMALHESKCGEKGQWQINKLSNKESSFKLTNSDDISDEICLSFLGKYPRDIVSGYYSFHDMIKELTSLLKSFYAENQNYKFGDDVTDEFLNMVHASCMNFINSIVLSNRDLKLFSKHVSEFILVRRMHWQLFVNYPLVYDLILSADYIDENQSNPTPFVEMICLLNFVEQLVVLVIPVREVHHGYLEMQNILRLCCTECIKKSDDLLNMLKQYNIYNMYNMISQFNEENREHQDILIDVICQLDLLNSKPMTDVTLNKEWYDLVGKVLYYRFSNIKSIHECKKFVFILNKPQFVDDTYSNLYSSYLDLVKRQLFDEPRIDSNESIPDQLIVDEKGNADTIDSMEANVLSLENVLDDLTLKLSDTEKSISMLESFGIEIDDVRGATPIKQAFKNILSMISRNNGAINRSYLISALDTIQLYLPNNIKTSAFSSWFRRLSEFLNKSLTLSQDETYKNYQKLCNKIQQNADDYIQAVSLNYFNEPASVPQNSSIGKMKEYYDQLTNDDYIKQRIDLLRKKEWRNMTERDDET